MNQFLFFAGLVFLTWAFFSFAHPLLRRLGLVSFAATIFSAGYFPTKNLWVGAACVAGLFLFPWLEILLRIRRLRLPLRKHLSQTAPPSRDVFPELEQITDDIESAGFEHVADLGWEMDEYRQFLRLFANPQKREEAAITCVEQNHLGFHFASVTSRGEDGSVYITWNCPVPTSLKSPPSVQLNRMAGEVSFDVLLSGHEGFLAERGIVRQSLRAVDPDSVRACVERDMESQMQHNIREGLLHREGEEHGRYSWRGMLFLWCQAVRDIFRFS